MLLCLPDDKIANKVPCIVGRNHTPDLTTFSRIDLNGVLLLVNNPYNLVLLVSKSDGIGAVYKPIGGRFDKVVPPEGAVLIYNGRCNEIAL